MDEIKPILVVKGCHKMERNNMKNKKMSIIGLSIILTYFTHTQ